MRKSSENLSSWQNPGSALGVSELAVLKHSSADRKLTWRGNSIWVSVAAPLGFSMVDQLRGDHTHRSVGVVRSHGGIRQPGRALP